MYGAHICIQYYENKLVILEWKSQGLNLTDYILEETKQTFCAGNGSVRNQI